MATVETATYGAEFVLARTCCGVEQLVDLRTTLRYIVGVPIWERSYTMFGDNESVVNSAILPHTKLHNIWTPTEGLRIYLCLK